MPKLISPHHQSAKDQLLADLTVYLKIKGISKAELAKRADMSPHDLHSIFRHDRAVSLHKLETLGKALGLELVMEWK